MNVPDTVGVSLIVITSDIQLAITPSGKPVGAPIPVAPVVDIVIGVKAVFTTSVGLVDGVPAVFRTEQTVIVPVAFTVPQPPVNGMI